VTTDPSYHSSQHVNISPSRDRPVFRLESSRSDLARLGVDSALMARPTQIHQF